METSDLDNPNCTFLTALNQSNVVLQEQVTATGATWLDVNEHLCPNGVCRPVRGGVYVYMDANHPTATYMRTIAPYVDQVLSADLAWWPSAAR